jgi:hypothetical protein
MREAPASRGANAARMACLLAAAPPVGIVLLVFGSQAPSPWFVALVVALFATILRVAVMLPRGDKAVFVRLWLALGVTSGIIVFGAFSVGPAFLMTLLMLILAIAIAPNRTGRSRAEPIYLALTIVAAGATITLPFVLT